MIPDTDSEVHFWQGVVHPDIANDQITLLRLDALNKLLNQILKQLERIEK